VEIFAGANGVLDQIEAGARDEGLDGAKHLDALGDDLRSDAITAEHGDLENLAHVVVGIA
jgi:hypothetical protein